MRISLMNFSDEFLRDNRKKKRERKNSLIYFVVYIYIYIVIIIFSETKPNSIFLHSTATLPYPYLFGKSQDSFLYP